MADDEELPYDFTGFKIDRDDQGLLKLHQHDYLRSLKMLPEDAPFASFAWMRMKLAWLAHSRPDCLFGISQLTQVTREVFETDRRTVIKNTNKLLKFTLENSVVLSFPKLDMN